MSNGVIYVAIGDQFIKESLQSAESLKRAMPKIHTTIFCDHQLESKYFDDVVVMKKDHLNYPGLEKLEKIRCIRYSPYEKSIFLDTDTYVCNDISELFTLLDQFDIATAHAPVRDATKVRKEINYSYSINIPESFPEMNTGVIVLKKNELTENLFRAWFQSCEQKIANKGKPLHDQTAFREVLYTNNARVATLTPEYNFRFKGFGFAIGKIKILHGRHPDLPSVEKKSMQLMFQEAVK